MQFLILIALALAPGIAIVLFFYLKDHHEPEPLKSLLLGLLYGVLSFGVFLAIGLSLDAVTEIEAESLVDQLIRAFIFVGLLEEGSKFLFLRGILYRSKNFNEPFDGIVYAVMVGMGFAMAENVVYVLKGGASIALVRMFTAVPAHAMFAVIMGFFLGEAKVFPTSSALFSTMALLFAALAHGFYDYFLFVSFIPGLWIQAMVCLVIALVLTHFAMKRHQQESPHLEDED